MKLKTWIIKIPSNDFQKSFRSKRDNKQIKINGLKTETDRERK